MSCWKIRIWFYKQLKVYLTFMSISLWISVCCLPVYLAVCSIVHLFSMSFLELREDLKKASTPPRTPEQSQRSAVPGRMDCSHQGLSVLGSCANTSAWDGWLWFLSAPETWIMGMQEGTTSKHGVQKTPSPACEDSENIYLCTHQRAWEYSVALGKTWQVIPSLSQQWVV